MIYSCLVSEEVGEDNHLGNDGSVLKNFLLNAAGFNSKAVINDFVELIFYSARIRHQKVVEAFSYYSSVGLALLWHESLSLAEVQHFVYIASTALVIGLVAIDDLLAR